MMQPGDDKIVADRIYGVLAQKRSPKSPHVPPPAANLSGRWDVSVDFFSSKSQHTLLIEQDGNRIQGSHKGDFSVRDLYGTIEGEQVRLRSTTAERGPVFLMILPSPRSILFPSSSLLRQRAGQR